MPNSSSSLRRGIACILLSAFGFALMTMFVRLADGCGGAPLPAVQKAFFRNLVAAVIAAWAFFGRTPATRPYRRMPFGVREWSELFLRAFAGTCGIFANFYAISHIPVGDAMALNKTAPFFTLLLSWLLLGEHMTLRQSLCVVGAFGGAMLVVKPGLGGTFSIPALVGLMGGFCAGAAYALLHKLGKAGIDSAFIILFFSVFSCAACIPFIVCDYHPMTPLQFAALLGAGAGAAIGQFGITWAYRSAEPRQIAVYDYSGIIFAAALGFMVFGQVPDVLSFIGFVAIIGMAVVLHRGRRGKRSWDK